MFLGEGGSFASPFPQMFHPLSATFSILVDTVGGEAHGAASLGAGE